MPSVHVRKNEVIDRRLRHGRAEEGRSDSEPEVLIHMDTESSEPGGDSDNDFWSPGQKPTKVEYRQTGSLAMRVEDGSFVPGCLVLCSDRLVFSPLSSSGIENEAIEFDTIRGIKVVEDGLTIVAETRNLILKVTDEHELESWVRILKNVFQGAYSNDGRQHVGKDRTGSFNRNASRGLSNASTACGSSMNDALAMQGVPGVPSTPLVQPASALGSPRAKPKANEMRDDMRSMEKTDIHKDFQNPEFQSWLASWLEPPVYMGLLYMKRDNSWSLRFVALFKDRLTCWSRPMNAALGGRPLIHIDLGEVCGLESTTGGFVLNCRGSKITFRVANNDDFQSWSKAFLGVLAPKIPTKQKHWVSDSLQDALGLKTRALSTERVSKCVSPGRSPRAHDYYNRHEYPVAPLKAIRRSSFFASRATSKQMAYAQTAYSKEGCDSIDKLSDKVHAPSMPSCTWIHQELPDKIGDADRVVNPYPSLYNCKWSKVNVADFPPPSTVVDDASAPVARPEQEERDSALKPTGENLRHRCTPDRCRATYLPSNKITEPRSKSLGRAPFSPRKDADSDVHGAQSCSSPRKDSRACSAGRDLRTIGQSTRTRPLAFSIGKEQRYVRYS